MTTTPRASESPAHLALKRVALEWAQQNGFRIAATEVALPNRDVRMDVAAYRPQRIKKQKGNRLVSCAAIGVTAIFECKVSTPDFCRDAADVALTTIFGPHGVAKFTVKTDELTEVPLLAQRPSGSILSFAPHDGVAHS